MLIGVLALFLFIYEGVNLYSSWKADSSRDSAEALTVTGLDTEDIRKIRYTNTAETVTCEKEGERWYYAKDKAFPLKQSCIEEAVGAFAQIRGNRKLEEAEDPASYGLEEPAYTVTLTDAKGKDTIIQIGDTAVNSDYYLTADNGKTIYTASSLLVEDLIFDEDLLIQNETFPEIDSSSLKSITKKRKGGKAETYSSRNEDSDSKEKTQTFYIGDVFDDEGDEAMYVQLKGSNMVYKVYASGMERLLR